MVESLAGLRILQEKQCSEATIPFHPWGTDPFRSDRMPEAIGITAICGQEIRLLGHHVTAG